MRLAGQAVAQRLQFGVPTLQPPVDRPGDDVAAGQHREAGQREIVRRELQFANPVQHAPRPQHALMAASQDLAAAIGEGGHVLAALIERGQLGAIGQPPAMDAPVPASGGELGAVRRQYDRGELRLGLKPLPQLARGEVPDNDHAIVAGADRGGAVQTDGDGRDRGGVADQAPADSLAGEIPYQNGVIEPARHHSAPVGRDRDGPHRAAMAEQGGPRRRDQRQQEDGDDQTEVSGSPAHGLRRQRCPAARREAWRARCSPRHHAGTVA